MPAMVLCAPRSTPLNRYTYTHHGLYARLKLPVQNDDLHLALYRYPGAPDPRLRRVHAAA